jgi:hypothetical protein
MKTSDTPSTPLGKINETNRIATDIDTSIPDFLKRKKGDTYGYERAPDHRHTDARPVV